MEVIKSNAAMLSNYEVLTTLKRISSAEKGSKLAAEGYLATVVYETTKYLENTPCRYQSEEVIKQFLTTMLNRKFDLTKAEKLQLLNQRPTTPVEIQLMVEEIEERLSDDEMNSLLTVIATVLPESDANEMNCDEPEMVRTSVND